MNNNNNCGNGNGNKSPIEKLIDAQNVRITEMSRNERRLNYENRKLQNEFDELKRRSINKDTYDKTLKEKNDMIKKWERKYMRLKQFNDATGDGHELKRNNDTLKAEMRNLNIKIQELENDNNKLKDEISKVNGEHHDQMLKIRKEYDAKINSLENVIVNNHEEIEELKRSETNNKREIASLTAKNKLLKVMNEGFDKMHKNKVEHLKRTQFAANYSKEKIVGIMDEVMEQNHNDTRDIVSNNIEYLKDKITDAITTVSAQMIEQMDNSISERIAESVPKRLKVENDTKNMIGIETDSTVHCQNCRRSFKTINGMRKHMNQYHC